MPTNIQESPLDSSSNPQLLVFTNDISTMTGNVYYTTSTNKDIADYYQFVANDNFFNITLQTNSTYGIIQSAPTPTGTNAKKIGLIITDVTAGKTIAYTPNGTTSITDQQFTVTKGNTYLIAIQSPMVLNTSIDYTLKVSNPQNAIVDEDTNGTNSPIPNTPNTAKLTAGIIGSTTTVSGKIGGYIVSNNVGITIDPYDYYQFTLPTNANVTLQKTSLTSVQNSYVVDSNNSIVDLTKYVKGGTYYLVVSSNANIQNSGIQNYTVNIGATVFDLAGNSIALANTTEFATLESSPNGISISDLIGSSDTADYYKFTLTKPAKLTFTTDSTLTNQATFKIVDANEQEITNLEYVKSGVYYVKIISSANPDVVYQNVSLKAELSPWQPKLTYSANSFDELDANDGSVSEMTVTLINDTFTGADNSTLSITGTNVPAGLTLVATKLTDTTAKISFTGKATANNSANSITNLSFSFANSAFTAGNANDVLNATLSNIPINFTDNPRVIKFDPSALQEGILNNGAVDGFIAVTLENDTFAGATNAVLPITAINVPTGLTAVATKLTDTTAKISFTGKATNHNASNSIDTVKVILSDGAFAQGASDKVVNNKEQTFSILFKDAPILSYSASAFTETTTNDGSVTTITVTLNNDTFVGETNAILPITATNLPAGFTGISAVKLSDTTAQISLTGKANIHQVANNLSNLVVNFGNGAFITGSASGVTDASKTLGVTYTDNIRKISFDTTTLTEALKNDGSVSNVITVTLEGDTFTGAINSNLAITSANIPTGLTAVAKKLSDTTAQISFTGKASVHEALNSVNNLQVLFADSAFGQQSASTVINNSALQTISLKFKDAPILNYSSLEFNELAVNDGSLSTITATLDNDIFLGEIGAELAITGTNIPTGLTLKAIKESDTTATIKLLGNATLHQGLNSTTALNFVFGNTAFNSGSATGVVNASKSGLAVNFNDNNRYIEYSSTTFVESDSNDGSISNKLTIKLNGDTFVGTTGALLPFTVTNLPAGLTTSIKKIDDTTAELAITGKASLHEKVNNITNLQIVLGDKAFNQQSASTVKNNSTLQPFSINFKDAPYLSYSTSNFMETPVNNGTVSSIVVTVTNDSFTGNVGDLLAISAKNLPAGFTGIQATKIDDTHAEIKLLGQGSLHQLSHSVNNVVSTFANSAFASGNALSVKDSSKTLFIDYTDNIRTLSFDKLNLNESALNDGSLEGQITVTLMATRLLVLQMRY